MTVARSSAERLDRPAEAAALRDAAGTARELAVVLSRLASLHEQGGVRRDGRDARGPFVRQAGPPSSVEALHGRAELLLQRLRAVTWPGPADQRGPSPVSSPAGTGRAVWQSLTAAERQVVRAVTAGRTNREAADVLFLSPHTVNSHLRHVYVKLGISSRTELVRLTVCHAEFDHRPQT